METIHFIGISNGIKPRLILEEVWEHRASFSDKKIYFITDDYDNDGKTENFCKIHDIKVLKANGNDVSSILEIVKMTQPQMLISIGWSWKIPDDFLNLFHFAINCHGGLLPDYRGNNVYMHNYANLSEYYGTTIHYMNSKFDDGNIILQARAKLYLEETPLIIHRRICEMTAQILPESISLVERGYLGEKQRVIARYFYKIDRDEMEKIRQINIESIRKGEEIKISRHKEWKLSEGVTDE